MKKLIIAGAGGFGREVLQWALQSVDFNKKFIISGFIDDDKTALDKFSLPFKILGTITEWIPSNNEVFIVAAGHVNNKMTIESKLTEKGACYINIIHPTAIINDTATLGVGNIICPNVVISDSAFLNNHASINVGSIIGHDAIIGPYSVISSQCDITASVIIGEGVFLGSKVSILPGMKIGRNSYLCAGSVIMSDVKEESRMFGVPAKIFHIGEK
jgi:sugar O-acyltransferase (sialic acid O-acetyltransferase NeuD family)